MSSDKKKTCGEVFPLMLKPKSPDWETLIRFGRIGRDVENGMWQTWRRNDPVTAVEFARLRQVRERKGKWPKLPAHGMLKRVSEGPSATKIARVIGDGLGSAVYDTIANHVGKLYMKKRFALLSNQERLPVSDKLRIRFRERACTIVPDPTNPDKYFAARLVFGPKENPSPIIVSLKAVGKSKHTMDWLRGLAKSGEHPSGGCVSYRKKNGKWQWQISLSRPRGDGEIETVSPVAKRTMVVYAPPDQKVFLWCQVRTDGAPWRSHVEDNDLLAMKRGLDRRRKTHGARFNQTQQTAAHGHGRNRAIAAKLRFNERYDNAVKTWIEQRSAWIVRKAREWRCEELHVEELSKRESDKLRLGSFPYAQLVKRIGDKAKETGLNFKTFASLDDIEDLFAA